MVRRLSLLLVLVLAGAVLVMPGVAAGGGCHAGPSARMTSSERTLLGIAECSFVDTVTYVDVGERVTWVNKDFVPHSVTGAALAWGDEEFLERGDRVTYSFEEEGVYPYYCVLHPSMVGAVVVGDGINTAALGAGAAPVEKVEDAAPAGATRPGAPDDGGVTPALMALSLAAALGALFFAGRYALARRARPSAVS
ncbi:MAG TPA: plastocyanin/azurin family copper-binding protein [Actinomycetota bacterium]|nr:plastocyanin/azurin family copper-binding protein [Actinomycetota bacterium]